MDGVWSYAALPGRFSPRPSAPSSPPTPTPMPPSSHQSGQPRHFFMKPWDPPTDSSLSSVVETELLETGEPRIVGIFREIRVLGTPMGTEVLRATRFSGAQSRALSVDRRGSSANDRKPKFDARCARPRCERHPMCCFPMARAAGERAAVKLRKKVGMRRGLNKTFRFKQCLGGGGGGRRRLRRVGRPATRHDRAPRRRADRRA